MDELKPTTLDDSAVLPGPQLRKEAEAPPTDFVPLRLVLRPSGMQLQLLQVETVVGRHAECDLRLPLADVSRRHCRFVFAGGQWQVFDLKSLNGVYVNYQKVEQATLHHHDVIRIGGFHFDVELPAEQATVEMSAAGSDRVLKSIADALPVTARNVAPPQRQAS